VALKLSTAALVAALVAMPSAAPAAASGPAAVMAVVHQFVDGFNRGDTKAALAACASPASIIDEFPPHLWQGPNACADWAHDLNALNEKAGITGGVVTLGAAWQLDVLADHAYVVVPARFTYKEHGKPQVESGSIFTLALKKTAAGWRIAAWAWAKH
jgi:ketosteroid isomerase-like protein